ncbi:MAG: DNA repair protein RecO [Christensenellaceae bacterium]
MERKTDGLVLRSHEYRENDRLLTVLTADLGRITVTARGVRKADAKLRFAAQPFCFAEFVLAEKAGRFTLTGAASYESFFPLWEDPDQYYAASAVAEIAYYVIPEEERLRAFFVETVKALRNLIAGEREKALLCYLLAVAKECGVPLTADRCVRCGGALLPPRLSFDFEEGGFLCSDCPGTEVSIVTREAISSILTGRGTYTREGGIRALRLLRRYLIEKTGLKADCLSQYVSMLAQAGKS